MADKTGFSDVSYSNPPPYDAHQPQPTVVQGAVVATMVPGTVIIGQRVGSKPTRMQCGSCRADIVTRIVYKNSTRTHIIALILCVFGCWPCACIPYCVDSCKSVEHFCPYCNAFIGTYKN